MAGADILVQTLVLVTCCLFTTSSLPTHSDKLLDLLKLMDDGYTDEGVEAPVESLIAELRRFQNYLKYQRCSTLLRMMLAKEMGTEEMQPVQENIPESTEHVNLLATLSETGEDDSDMALRQLMDLAKKHTRNPPGKRFQEPILEPRDHTGEAVADSDIKWVELEMSGEELDEEPTKTHVDSSVQADDKSGKSDMFLLVSGDDYDSKSESKSSEDSSSLKDNGLTKPKKAELKSMINFLENYIVKMQSEETDESL